MNKASRNTKSACLAKTTYLIIIVVYYSSYNVLSIYVFNYKSLVHSDVSYAV